jgi:hypothetical protein
MKVRHVPIVVGIAILIVTPFLPDAPSKLSAVTFAVLFICIGISELYSRNRP